MGQQEKFQQLINQENALFNPVCSMMRHSKVNDGRNFLCAMNNIIDYYCKPVGVESVGINYKVIYVPSCPEWARELLVRFLIQKLAFTSSNRFLEEAKKKVSKPVYLPYGITNKESKYLFDERKYNN